MGKVKAKNNHFSTVNTFQHHRLLVCIDFSFSVGWVFFLFGGFGFWFFFLGGGRHLIYALIFFSQVSGIKDNRNKAGNQVIFSRPGV